METQPILLQSWFFFCFANPPNPSLLTRITRINSFNQSYIAIVYCILLPIFRPLRSTALQRLVQTPILFDRRREYSYSAYAVTICLIIIFPTPIVSKINRSASNFFSSLISIPPPNKPILTHTNWTEQKILVPAVVEESIFYSQCIACGLSITILRSAPYKPLGFFFNSRRTTLIRTEARKTMHGLPQYCTVYRRYCIISHLPSVCWRREWAFAPASAF